MNKPDPVVLVDQQGVCAALDTSSRHVGEGVQIPFYFFSRDDLELTLLSQMNSHSVSQSLSFFI